MSTLRTSTDWATIVALHRALSEQLFDTSATAVGPVKVHLGWPAGNELAGDESVTVNTMSDTPVEQTYLTWGPGIKEETFGLRVTIQVASPGLTVRQCGDRLTELRSTVEELIRGIGSPLASGQARRPDVPGVQWWWVSRGDLDIAAASEGARGIAHLYITVRSRI